MKILISVMGYAESATPNISGGDMRWLKFARWLRDQGHQVTILASAQCRDFMSNFGLQAEFISAGRLGPLNLRGGLKRMLMALKLGRHLSCDYDLLYSVTSLAYDVLPLYMLKKRRLDVKLTVICHWVAPLTGRNTSLVSALSLYLCDRLGIFLSRSADAVLCVSRPTFDKVRRFRFLDSTRLHATICGVDFIAAPAVSHERRTAAIHIKRIAASKGSYDLPVIWRHVTAALPEARLIICGDGSPQETDCLRQLIKEQAMELYINYLGPVYDEREKYRLLQDSRVFVLPSYEENWAIVIGEALSCGLEVVCYDLPDIRPVWGEQVHWIPKGDREAFARIVVGLLNGTQALRNTGGHHLATWAEVFQKEFELMAATGAQGVKAGVGS